MRRNNGKQELWIQSTIKQAGIDGLSVVCGWSVVCFVMFFVLACYSCSLRPCSLVWLVGSKKRKKHDDKNVCDLNIISLTVMLTVFDECWMTT